MRRAQERYRTFVAEGLGGPSPWKQLRGQIYLGSDEFIAQHQPDRMIQKIPRQTDSGSSSFPFSAASEAARVFQLIHESYRQHGYRPCENAIRLGVHYATVSLQLKRTEQTRYDCKTRL